MIDLSDELLMAYVDGQLDKPQTTVVSRLLRDDPDLAVRVSRLQQTQAQLLDTFGALLREGASASARAKQTKRRAGALLFAGDWKAAGVAAALVFIGAGVGLSGAYLNGMMGPQVKEVAQLSPTNWPGDIAEFHAFFTAEAMQVSPESQTNPEMVGFQLSQAFEGISLPDFQEQGLNLVRGQMLNYRGNKVMQLTYLGKKQPLVALYISAGGLDMPMSPGRFGDLNTISWSANERRYVLAANMPHQPLQALAVIANAQLGAK
ncbi:MAG: anti-sigma factor family protein [Rhodomicrobiaceae bacterium]